MEKKCRFSYSEIDDSLIISCREENESVKENFMLDNFIFSLTGKGKIVGIQIREASNVLLENNINPNILKNILEINLVTLKKENCLFIAINIISNQIKAALPLRVFLPEMVVA
ncbi:hypothetical protein HYW74_03180 [Candidatus Pacearchaeota archaeon]|nr:hypothetical protein [Candidatus Pacearchaeota archaeon]